MLQFLGEAKITVGHTGIECNCKKIPNNVHTRKYMEKKRYKKDVEKILILLEDFANLCKGETKCGSEAYR